MKQLALCHTCQHQHHIEFNPEFGAGNQYSDWIVKHAGHIIEFRSPRKSKRDKKPQRIHSWENYVSNANVLTSYSASAAVTITLASLAASSTLLAGQESTLIDNGASNKYLDYLITGNFKTAASNAQVGSINVAVVGNHDDTPVWPDVFDGTNSTETVSQQTIYDQVCKVAACIATIATNSLTYWFGPIAIAGLFGGIIPDQFVIFVSHNAETTTNVWSATEGDHSIHYNGIYATVA